MRNIFFPLVLTVGLIAPGTIGQEGKATECVPSYVDELRELAKLRDEGIVTSEEFELKKRNLLGLDADSAVALPASSQGEDAEPDQATLLETHCHKGLLSLMKSPASTKIVKTSIFPSPELPKTMKRVVAERQSLSAPGTTIYIEYDSSNSYGALIRGNIACDYTDPPHFMNDMAIIPRTVSFDGKPLDKNDVTIFGIDASLEMIPEFSALKRSKQVAGERE